MWRVATQRAVRRLRAATPVAGPVSGDVADDRRVIAPVIIDIEASGFGRGSYPIEIGYHMPGGQSWCTLVRPAADWTHWDPAAEQVHGIARDLLFKHGRSPEEICLALNLALRGLPVYCDAWAYDYVWLSRLYDEAELPMTYRLKDLRELLGECEQQHWHEIRDLIEQRLQLPRHRASGDARILSETLAAARQRCGKDCEL